MMNRISLLFLLLCWSAISATAQYQYDYQKTYSTSGPSSEGEDLVELPGGNMLVAATRSVPISGGVFQANILLMKLKPNGDTVWTKEFGVATSREYAESITLLPDGRVIIAGYITDVPTGTADALLILADTNGNLVWQKRIGGLADDFANAVKQTPDGFIVGGVTYGSLVNGGDAWLLKVNQTGDSLWSKTFGGPLYDDCWDIALTPENGFMLTGGNYSFASGSLDDAWIIKTDSLGNELWKKLYGLANRVDWSWSITPEMVNGSLKSYVFVGIKNSEENYPGAAYGDLHFVKVDTGGNVIWDKSITQSGGHRLEGRDIKQTPDGGFLICGYRLSPVVNGTMFYVLKTDSAGIKQWDTSYADNGQAYMLRNILPTADGGFAVTGILSTPAPTQHIIVTRFKGTTNSIRPNDARNISFSVAPNPNNGSFLLEGTMGKAGMVSATITDVSGRLIYEDAFKTSDGNIAKQISLQGRLPAGTYLLTVAGREGKQAIKVQVD